MLIWGLCCVMPDAKISLCSTVQHSLFNRRWQFRIRFIQLSSYINYWNGLGFPCLGDNLFLSVLHTESGGQWRPPSVSLGRKATGNAFRLLLKSPTKPCSQGEQTISRTCCKTQLFTWGLWETNVIDQHDLEEGMGFFHFFLVEDKKSHVHTVVSPGWVFKSLQKILVVCFPPLCIPS